MLSIGQGYDIHRLVEGRPLRLGLVEIPFERGLLGHSDGDAAAHALCDALLGAARIGDMGLLFPSSDARWKDARSELFLAEARRQIESRGAVIVSADVTIIIEKPRMAPYLEAMRTAMANALGISVAQLSVKAKSNDGIGAIGESSAVAALASALVEVSAPS